MVAIEHVSVEPGGYVRVLMDNHWTVTVRGYVTGKLWRFVITKLRLGLTEVEAHEGPTLDDAAIVELLASLEAVVHRPEVIAALRANQSAEFDG